MTINLGPRKPKKTDAHDAWWYADDQGLDVCVEVDAATIMSPMPVYQVRLSTEMLRLALGLKPRRKRSPA